MPQSTITTILEYIWVPIVTGMVWLWGRVFGVDARTGLLELQAEHYKEQREDDKSQREEDQTRHDKQRDEILSKIDAHHNLIMDKLNEVDKRVKNGH